MNAILHCEIRLSKKLEKLVADGEAIEIYIGPVKDGIATGMVKITTAEGVTLKDLNALGETSVIMRTPQAEELAPDLGNDEPMQALFTENQESPQVPTPKPAAFPVVPPTLNPQPANNQYVQASYPQNIAITNPDQSPVLLRQPPGPPSNPPSPQEIANLQRHLAAQPSQHPAYQWPPLPRQQSEQGRSAPVVQARQAVKQYAQRAYAPPQPQQMPPPMSREQFEEQQRLQYEHYQREYMQQQQAAQAALVPPIMSFEELMAELQAVPGIDQPVPYFSFDGQPGSPAERQSMIAFEQQMLQMPRLQRPCYIRNDVAGRLEIQDMGYTMLLHQVLDLSRFPARRVLESRQFRELYQNNMLTFVTYDDLVESLQAPDPIMKSYLPVGSCDDVEGAAIDGGKAAILDVDRYNPVRTSARRHAGLRRTGQAEFADNGETSIDPEFAELVADLPAQRVAREQAQSPGRWQPPQRASALSKPINRIGASGDDFIQGDDSIYIP